MASMVLATKNAHKVRELARMLEGAADVEPLPDEISLPPETGTTFAENALIKARAAAGRLGRAAVRRLGIDADALGGGARGTPPATPDPTRRIARNLAKFRRECPGLRDPLLSA
jgi:XTP/dITP diphosphohydrolase